MVEFAIADEIKKIAPNLILGCVTADVQTAEGSAPLSDEMDYAASQVPAQERDLTAEPPIAALRNLYKSLGKDPSRYRGSPEALLRRVRSGKGLYRVLNVVDIINIVSLRTLLPIGLYDRAQLKPPIVLRRGSEGEIYTGIGKGALNLSGLPLLSDEAGPFGSPTSDSERTMIRPETTHIMGVIFGVTEMGMLQFGLEHAGDLLSRFASAQNIQTFYVE